MRIVILYNTSWYVYLLRRNLIARLQEAGCEVFVVAPRDTYSDRLTQLGVRYLPIPLDPGSTSPLKELKTLVAILRVVRDLKPDAVLSYTIKCNLYTSLVKRFVPFHQVANISGLGSAFDKRGPMRVIANILYRVGLHSTEDIFFQNREDLAACVRSSLVNPRRCTVIPGSGVDLLAFTPSPRKHNRPRTFLMFGRLLPQKGYDLYLNVALRAREEFGDSSVFWILGKPDFERSESIALYHRIMRAHAVGSVRYLQSSDEVRPILSEADVVVLPSTYNEGIPRSLLEALACGKAVITTDWKGCRETVEHERNGYLTQPHSEDSLYDAVRTMITCDEHTLKEFGDASRARAESLFDEEIVLNAYLSALGLDAPATHAVTTPPAMTASLTCG